MMAPRGPASRPDGADPAAVAGPVPGAPFAPVPPGDEAIYERILSAVLDRRLPPGTPLVEEQLAGAFGVSRTRIRPVLARLAGEHLVTLTPHRRATSSASARATASSSPRFTCSRGACANRTSPGP